jgi:hypothetical protein
MVAVLEIEKRHHNTVYEIIAPCGMLRFILLYMRKNR